MNVREQTGGADSRGDRQEFLGARERLAAIAGGAQLPVEGLAHGDVVVDDGDGFAWAVSCAVIPDWRARYTVAVPARVLLQSANYLLVAATRAVCLGATPRPIACPRITPMP